MPPPLMLAAAFDAASADILPLMPILRYGVAADDAAAAASFSWRLLQEARCRFSFIISTPAMPHFDAAALRFSDFASFAPGASAAFRFRPRLCFPRARRRRAAASDSAAIRCCAAFRRAPAPRQRAAFSFFHAFTYYFAYAHISIAFATLPLITSFSPPMPLIDCRDAG
jgi:hypothetical protein